MGLHRKSLLTLPCELANPVHTQDTQKGEVSRKTLEGVLLGLAQNSPAMYNQAKSAPKDNKTGKIRLFHEWTLSNLIDVSCEVGFLREDVKKFSHSLRDFRNYIHPFQQMSENFSPDENTAKICFQVLKAALFQINNKTI